MEPIHGSLIRVSLSWSLVKSQVEFTRPHRRSLLDHRWGLLDHRWGLFDNRWGLFQSSAGFFSSNQSFFFFELRVFFFKSQLVFIGATLGVFWAKDEFIFVRASYEFFIFWDIWYLFEPQLRFIGDRFFFQVRELRWGHRLIIEILRWFMRSQTHHLWHP